MHTPARASALATLVLPAITAAGTPWILQPSIELSADYQSNPAFDTNGARDGSSEILSLSLPMSSQSGPYSFSLNASAMLRDGRGASADDNHAYDINGQLGFSRERGSVSVSAGSARSSLLGPGRVDLGVSRSKGYQISNAADIAASLQLSERDRVSASAGMNQLRFDLLSSADLVDGDFSSLGANYSRTINPRLQLFLSASAGRSESDDRTRRSTNQGTQAGISYQLSEVWNLSAAGGRSSVRNTETGTNGSGATYNLALARNAVHGTLSVSASRGLQASAFGTLVRQDDVALSYGTTLSPRLGLRAQLNRSEVRDTFVGFDLGEREYLTASLTFSYALGPVWATSVAAGYTRSVENGNAFRASASADSVGGTITLTRTLGPVGGY